MFFNTYQQAYLPDSHNSSQSQSIYDSILNHLFLPCYLPTSADSDYLIQSNHQNEHKLLECMNEFLNSLDTESILPIFTLLKNCVKNWLVVQNRNNCSVQNLQFAIQKLTPGDILPLYFHTQNAAILIEMDDDPNKQPLISSWQVALPAETITSSFEPHISYFPSPTYRLSNHSQLTSRIHCELLTDFMNNTIEYSKSYKSSQEFDEVREVPVAHYVCQWWITQFQGVQLENQANQLVQFSKKYRDQIRWKNTILPFRRSGLWMTIKVIFHTILTKHLGTSGPIVYKILITAFLTNFIYKRQTSTNSRIATDVLIHCLRKIARRLNKIEGSLSSTHSNDLNQWIQNITISIKYRLDCITPTTDWQEPIKNSEAKLQALSISQLILNRPEVYRHSCDKLQAYLAEAQLMQSSRQLLSNYKVIPSTLASVQEEYNLPSITILINEANYTIGIALARVEIWVESYLDQWINRSFQWKTESKHFLDLLYFFEKYQRVALDHYYYLEKNSSDPAGYTRFILTSLTIIRSMHRSLCETEKYQRLQLHSIKIPNLLDIFEFLILPNRQDMIRARDLYDYFLHFSEQQYPDILEDIELENAFGIYFASRSKTMAKTLQEIQTQIEQDKKQKIKEVFHARIKYEEFIEKAYNLLCQCNVDFYSGKCERCSIMGKANSIKVPIYECPLPSKEESALAVIFELQMPTEFRCYRDIIWMFVNRGNREPPKAMQEWMSVSPHNIKLQRFFTSSYHPCKVNLVSSTKSITQSHYSAPRSIASTPTEGFLFENSLQVQISSTKPILFQDECQALTPQLNDPNYKHLQFSMNSTQFAQNQVIAELSHCPLRLKRTQFVDFGSFRSGHTLQWWNLLSTLELDSLSMDEESVATLIAHSLLQYGPVTIDRDELVSAWCPESHQILLEDHFVDELISRMDRLLTTCGFNWQNEMVLVIITVIIMRVLTVCNLTQADKVTDLVLKCRRTGEKWIELISESIRNASSLSFDNMDALRDKIVAIGVACTLTFAAHSDRNQYLLSSNEHVISLLKIITTVHDNIILNKKKTNMSTFMKNLIRYSERILVSMQPTINKCLQETSFHSLDEFSTIYWAVIGSNGKMNGKWKKRNKDIHDGWYDGQYQSTVISIDCIRGTFLVNGTTIGFLPEKITSDQLFLRVFGDHVFEVQAAGSHNTYITKHAYHGDKKVHYEFNFDDIRKRLIIREWHIQINVKFELIPFSYLETELPDTFISNYSHWKNESNYQVEFRPIHFQDPKFLSDKHYLLTLNTGFVTTNNTENTQILINRASSFFQNLFNRYFIRLDDEPYVYMFRDNASEVTQTTTIQADAIIHIHLSRLGIGFKYDTRTNIISSREYSDMYVDKDQWFGTLTGLRAGLLLSPIMRKNQIDRQYVCRKLIVPFGQIHAEKTSDNDHQIVTVERKSPSAPFLHQYFVFILNDRLHILQSTDSPTGWLYLALLHAMTSHSLPDQYTGMTGMERSFQLLNSAGCWSDQPFDPISLNILLQIAAITPKADYYPEHLTCMEKIAWDTHRLPYSMQHFGYYLIAKKIFETSEQWSFMYSVSSYQDIREFFGSKKYNETLLTKLYWDYRDSYNPTVRLSAQMEADIRSINSTKPYQPIWKNYSLTTNYRPINLVDHLYSNGVVNLKDSLDLQCFPLSRWLTSEYELKNVWIGLFKFIQQLKTIKSASQHDEIERFEMLLDFLHYNLNQSSIEPFYLQMLKSILKASTALPISMSYPAIKQYDNIQEISVQATRIRFPKKLARTKHPEALKEINDCFTNNYMYQNRSFPERGIDRSHINYLLSSWRDNSRLRSFLLHIQNHINSLTLVSLNTKIKLKSPSFTIEAFKLHYQLQLNSTDQSLTQALLKKAKQKFMHPHSDYFVKSKTSIQTTSQQQIFPQQIFPSTDSQINSLSNIANHFKEQLNESWIQFQSTKDNREECPSIDEIHRFLNSFRQESIQFWNQLMKSITTANELLFKTGLMLRIVPTTLISVFQQMWLNKEEQQVQQPNDFKISNNRNSIPLILTNGQCTLLGGIMVNWVVEQQIERALHFASHEKWEDFEKEISNVPHVNWIPAEHVPWLIMELEMNITIREIQIEVARHMIQPNLNKNNSTIRNIVMQMNMGEGKTSVILPMLALNLSSPSSSLVRMIVLKSLFPMNYQSLRYKLGGLLNRRVLPFSCRRDMNFNNTQVNQIFDRLKQGLDNRDIILSSPEDILSFDLLIIDKCRRKEFDTGRSMLSVQRWLKAFARDILDESDEILHVKYQLIYSIGRQQQVDGGMERWKTIQSILKLVKQHAAHIAEQYSDDVFYKATKYQSRFPELRLLSHKPFSKLCERIVNDWLNQKCYRQVDQQCITSFILNTNSSIEALNNSFPDDTIQIFLILRGLLSSEVLLVALKRRYRVNFGVNRNSKFKRLMAVPFRAKDVAAENTEFGHPDIAIILTQLSYYYSGLNDSEMLQCFDRLNQGEKDPDMIYAEWILCEGENSIDPSIKDWKAVNVKDYQQRTQHLFPTLRHNMLVVNYYLNHFVFPREAKQFPHKLVSSAWDLSSSLRSKIITGFSGTNDTQLLLPIHIRQYDLPKLQKTDAIVLNNLLQLKNENYQSLSITDSSDDILKQIVQHKLNIQVILDVGALLIDGKNHQIAVKWLNLSDKNKIDYAVYFKSDEIFVCDRLKQCHAFLTSPASERLERCVFYLDEIHTRGTDFKFPNDFRAAVTLGSGLTKDRLVQACMRMRKLGNHHWLSFWSSNEVHQQIQVLKKSSTLITKEKVINNQITLIDILRWVYENTQYATWDGLHHWAAQSLSFQRKVTAFQDIHWNDQKQLFNNTMMEKLARECTEAEVVNLKLMYGAQKTWQTVSEIYDARYKNSTICSSTKIHEAVFERLRTYGGSKQLLAQLLDEEQQRELEQELEEERQQQRPPPVHPYEPILHPEIMKLYDRVGPMLSISHLTSVFLPISNAFFGTTFSRECQPNCWKSNLWVSTEFIRVIQTRGECFDTFLRPPRWIVVYRNQHIIFVSPFEANQLMSILYSLSYKKQSKKARTTTTLRLLLPRSRRDQLILVNNPALMIPSSGHDTVPLFIPTEILSSLFIFNGTLYFETDQEQTAYCQCLGLCPQPRTTIEKDAFEKGWIAVDGFVEKLEHRQLLQIDQCFFHSNPLAFIRKLIENRNNTHAPLTSHVGNIILNATKHIFQSS